MYSLFYWVLLITYWRIDTKMMSQYTAFCLLSYETNRFKLLCFCTVIDHRRCRCDENVRGTLGCVLCATFLFLLQIVVICELCSQRNNQKSFIILRLCPVLRVCLWQSVLIFSILCYTCSSCSSIAFFGFFLIPKQIFCIAA